MEYFISHIKNLKINILNDLLKQYQWENECGLDDHTEKINLIEEELKRRLH